MRALAVLLLALGLGTGLPGAAATWPDARTGLLAAIEKSGVVRVGYRADAVPFSYAAPSGAPMGYSIDLCAAIVDALAQEVERPLTVRYVKVTAADRVDQVANGAVDLECGSSSNTAARRERVAFSPTIFVAAMRLIVPRASPIRTAQGVRGRAVAVVYGTTAETTARELDTLRHLGLRIESADSYAAAIDLVAKGAADAIVADDVLLASALAQAGRSRDFRFLSEALSLEPYGIMFPRNDAAFADVVERALRGLAESREVLWIYDRWFVKPLPSAKRIGLPMSQTLRRSLELIGLPRD